MTNKITYKKSPYWNIFINNDQDLCIHAGADETYTIDELNKDEQKELLESISADNVDYLLENSSDTIKGVLKKLILAGVIVPSNDSPQQTTLRVGVIVSGGQTTAHQYIKETSGIIVVPLDEAEIIIVFRLSEKMEDVLPLVKNLTTPHFFVDLAYHHTVSFGPMVFPKTTACIGCLIGRIKERWGDTVAPEYSRSGSHYGLISELIHERLLEYSERKTMPMFVNSVWSFDVDKLVSHYDPVFRLPWCPYCFPERSPEHGGSFELPWTNNKDKK